MAWTFRGGVAAVLLTVTVAAALWIGVLTEVDAGSALSLHEVRDPLPTGPRG